MLKEGYNSWRDAYKGMTWEEYIKKVLELEESGKWVKDVIRYKLEGLFNDQ